MTEYDTALRVVEISQVSPGIAECLLKCLRGSVFVGDLLCIDDDPTSAAEEGLEILEIRYFHHLVRELETNFGGQVLLAGPHPERLKEGQLIHRCGRQGSVDEAQNLFD